VYARAFALVGDVWRYTDVAFTIEASVAPAAMVAPSALDAHFDTGRPFEWSPVAIARGYRLTIGTAPGGADLHDSGVIHVTRRFVPQLPIGLAYGTQWTKIDGKWISSDFTVAVDRKTTSTAVQIENAQWAAHAVRNMSFDDNRPFSWTELARRGFFVNCTDYVETFLQLWSEMNGQLAARASTSRSTPTPTTRTRSSKS
jgi:hypothetical protein